MKVVRDGSRPSLQLISMALSVNIRASGWLKVFRKVYPMVNQVEERRRGSYDKA